MAKAADRRDRLAQRRKVLGLTQEDLAGRLGIDRSTVVRWERGEFEPLPWIRPKLAKVLRVTADRLEDLLAAGAPATSRRTPPSPVPVIASGTRPHQGEPPVCSTWRTGRTRNSRCTYGWPSPPAGTTEAERPL